ncbi:hypothetical protein [Chitinophaga qingshengii]|uniref:LruC domain-containing protein n=1 Tax=Chitinophaga qingshengii TaxID=1569794 RepID=A0ABR7TVK2_9BACT|nr:hypothetical protein [Chitinophaga qingshengii]MBC9934457.1 hypothetical protein [Chitinophaga qingshengii]
MKYSIIYRLTVLLLVSCQLSSCYKADNFKNMLDALPQVSYQTGYSYRTSYTVGDTMTVTGRLQPNNGLKIRIGHEDAVIVAADSLHFRPFTGDSATIPMDWVKVMITDNMGSGADIPVTITSGGHTIKAANINIFGRYGEGSFRESLALTVHADITSPYNVFLHCINGKGDLYFYEYTTGNLQHIKKDGVVETLLTKAQLTGGLYNIKTFTAGGVNPQGTKAWISVQTDTTYAFVELDLVAKTTKVLNHTKAYTAPYIGEIGQVNVKVKAIYPDSKGNVFLVTPGVSWGQEKDYGAVAKYSDADRTISYQFRTNITPEGLPGVDITDPDNPFVMMLPLMLPDESVMYLPGSNKLTVYDLQSRVVIKTLKIQPEAWGVLPNSYTGAFNGIKINFSGYIGNNSSPETGFGFLPRPGQKMIFLLYQYLEGRTLGMASGNMAPLVGGPKWMAFDFAEGRTYQYAPQADLSGFAFEPFNAPGKPASIFPDQLLNYDAEGHLYATANGRKKIVRTILK